MKITIKLPSRTINADLPDTWNDTIVQDETGTRNPALAITLLQIIQLDGPSLMEKRIAILKHLLQLTEKDIQDWQLSLAADHGQDWQLVFFEQIRELLAATDFLLEKASPPDEIPETNNEHRTYHLNPSLTTCPVPVLHVPAAPQMHRRKKRPAATTLHAPADGLANITGWELAMLFDLYERYAATRDARLIDELIATMYRKSKVPTPEQLEQNWHGDRRQPYNEHTVKLRQHQVGHLPPQIKNIIFFWFLSCRMSIISQFENVFKKKDERKRSGNDYGWWAVFRNLAGNLKDTEVLARMNYLDLLTELSFLEDERMKEEMRRDLAKIPA